MGYGLLFGISVLVPFLTIIPQNFPSLGISVSFLILATLILYLKKRKNPSDWLYYTITIFLSLFLIIRSNPFMVFLNTVAVFYFGSLLILEEHQRNILHFAGIVFLPFKLIRTFTKTENKFTFDWAGVIKKKNIDDNKIKEFIISALIGLVVLVIIVPLLSYSNPIFQSYVNSFFKIFNLQEFLEKLFGEQFMIYFGRAVLFGLLLLLLPRLSSYILENHEVGERKNRSSLPLIIPMVLTTIVIGVFFVTQIQLYTASTATLQQMGITHSEYAREVFGQLSVVAFIIFILIYNNQQKNSLTQILSYILILEGIFLTLIAFKSDLDYASEFGFTHKRLWGFTGVAWFIWLFMLFFYREAKKLSRELFIHDLVVFSGILLLLVNMFNFDYVIYHYSNSRTEEGIDYRYMANTLSADSLAYKELIQKVYEQGEKTKQDELYRMYTPMNNMIWKIRNLQEKYKNIDWRAFNYTEYKQYEEIRDLKLDKYEKALNTNQFIVPQ